MAQFGFEFDATSAENNGLLEAGDYQGVIIESEVKESRKRTGRYAVFTVQISQPEKHRNEKIKIFITISHASKEAEKYGKKDLAKLCAAVGVSGTSDSVALHGKPFQFSAKIDDGDLEPRNKFGKFRAIDPAATMAAMPPPVVQQPQTGSVANPFARA